MTAVIFRADARLMVLIINKSSMRVSFTGGDVGWMMYTSFPRTFSLITTLTSPSANLLTVILPRFMPRWLAISWARGLFALPVNTLRPVGDSEKVNDRKG